MKRSFLLIGVFLPILVMGCRQQTQPKQSAQQGNQGQAQPQSPSPLVNMGDAYALLGKHFKDKAVEEFMGPGMKYCYTDSTGAMACPLLGVTLHLGDYDRISHVTFHPNAIGHYKPYAGPLPFGLARGDTRAVVRSKLGHPDESLTDTDLYTSRSPRVSVTYYTDASPQAGLISKLQVSLVE